jgi:hypothetical protein
MKKLIKYAAIITLISTAVISCSSDASQGMLRTIVDSQEEVSYTIKNSSFNDGGKYFVSVEADGIYKTSYLLNEKTDNVERELYVNSGKDKITTILDIYTEEDDSYILTEVVTGPSNNPITTTTLKHFDNSDLNSSFQDVPAPTPVITGNIKNLTENGYIISTETDTVAKTSHIHIYKIDPSTQAITKIDTAGFSVINFYNTDRELTRYNNYALVKDVTDPNNLSEGIIISLTDSDDTLGTYVALDAYYYVSTSANSYSKIAISDSDNDGESEQIVAATKINPTNYMLLTKDGDCYQTDLNINESPVTELWNNKDLSDEFSNHLPTLNYTVGVNNYLMAMNDNNHIYQYYTDATNTTKGRKSTLSDITVKYASSLNHASDIINIQSRPAKTYNGTLVDVYWVATKDNGYYTIYIEPALVNDESSDYHATFDGLIE